MIHRLAKSIATYFIQENIIERKYFDMYIYGAEVLISGIVGIINVMLVSIILNTLHNGIVFLLIFIPIRMYIGGYHASSYLACNLWFTFIYFLTIQIQPYMNKGNGRGVLWLLVLAGFMTIIRYAPLDNINKKIPEQKRGKYKMIGCAMYLFFMMSANIIMLIHKIGDYVPVSVETGVYINIVLVTVCILFVIGMGKERSRYEKENDKCSSNDSIADSKKSC